MGNVAKINSYSSVQEQAKYTLDMGKLQNRNSSLLSPSTSFLYSDHCLCIMHDSKFKLSLVAQVFLSDNIRPVFIMQGKCSTSVFVSSPTLFSPQSSLTALKINWLGMSDTCPSCLCPNACRC